MDKHLNGEAVPEIVETASGKLAGDRKNGISRFKGIPFAKAPTGPLRWRMPEPVAPWAGVRDATHFGFVCPQAPTQLETLMGLTVGEPSEDCLYLNVWTPACDGAKRPVMVWFHGGAFVIGAGSQGVYNGKHLAARDVVVVTVNYRLGAFGFLNLQDATDGRAPGTGSEGLADQIMALSWVRANIASFGGDPGNVTIFGESAGAMSVSSLLAAEPARGLFHKAIAQSGGGHIGYAREKSARVARAILDALDIAPETGERALAVPYGAIIKAMIAILGDARDGEDTRHLGRMPFQPTIDGAILAERPIEAIRKGAATNIPLLTGTTKEEWKLFTAAAPQLRLMSRASLEKKLARALGAENAPPVLAVYDKGSPFERWNAITTDRVFTLPCWRMLEAQTKVAPAFGYRFDWKSKLMAGIFGSCHALDIGFVFGTHSQRLGGRFFGTGPQADALAADMMDAWAAFARTGNPATASTGPWPRYDARDRQLMCFGDGPPHRLEKPNETQRLVWDKVPEKKLGV